MGILTKKSLGGNGGLADAYCSGCDRDRSNDPLLTSTKRAPCPECGDTRLTYKRAFTDTVTATASVTTALRPGVQDRNWKVRWEQLETRVIRVTGNRGEPRSAVAIHSAAQDLFEFFVSAYSLKDAIKKDGVVLPATVEDAIDNSPKLALLADLANLDKHRRLDPTKYRIRSGDVPVIGDLADSSEGATWRLQVPIRHKGKIIDGVSFAQEIVDEWRLHLTDWGLLK